MDFLGRKVGDPQIVEVDFGDHEPDHKLHKEVNPVNHSKFRQRDKVDERLDAGSDQSDSSGEAKKSGAENEDGNKEDEDEAPLKQLIIEVNQEDPSAGLFYSHGFSLIHLTMFIAIFFCNRPNWELLKKADDDYLSPKFVEEMKEHFKDESWNLQDNFVDLRFCEGYGHYMNEVMNWQVAIHLISFFALFQTEIITYSDATSQGFSKMMEVTGLCLYLMNILASLEMFLKFHYTQTFESLMAYKNIHSLDQKQALKK